MTIIKTLLSPLTPRSRWPRPALGTRLAGPRVVLRAGEAGDWRDWRNLRSLSRPFLEPWEPLWPPDSLTYDYFCGNLRRQWREWREGSGYAFLIFRDEALIGGITLNDVMRGVAQKGTLGYWIGQPYAGQGLMTEAAAAVCAFAFDTLKLHRVEASCLPRNEPSKRLLQKLNFTQEGFAQGYLRINGQWEDHLLWGRLAP